MKKLLVEYCNIIGFTICGIVFGFSFFLLLLNFYHYKEVNTTYIKQDSDFKSIDILNNKLNSINENIALFDPNKYKGNQDVYSLASLKSRLNTCVTKINNSDYKKMMNKKEINIQDVYEMQQFYQINIANECLVKQLYEVTLPTENKIKIPNLKNPFMENNINQLIKSSDFLQKVIKNNSSYYFSSYSSKSDLYDQTKDSYYSLMNNYSQAIDFIYDFSLLYKEVSK